MGGILKILAFTAPVAAILLWFSLQGQEEIKVEQQIEKIDQQIEKENFDAEFSAAWNSAGGKSQLPRNESKVAELKKKKAALEQQSESLNVQSNQDMSDLRQALEAAGEKQHDAK